MGRLNINYMFVKIRPAAFQNELIGEEKKTIKLKSEMDSVAWY